jgi:hypothetical protein
MSIFKRKNVGNLTTISSHFKGKNRGHLRSNSVTFWMVKLRAFKQQSQSHFEWKIREHLNNNHSLNLKGKNLYRDTTKGHSWLSIFKICRMMCPKPTRRNSMLPSSFKREKRWQNADMEMNSFSIARIPLPHRQEYKSVFHFLDTNIKCRQEIKLFFSFQDTNTMQTVIQNVFHFPDTI